MTDTTTTPPPVDQAELAATLRAVVDQFMTTGPGKPWALRSEAATKIAEATKLFDDADAIEHAVNLRKAVDAAATKVAEAAQDEQDARKAVDATRAALNRAQQRFNAAEDNARQAERDELRAQRKSPAEQTDALLRVRAAGDVVARERAALEGAQARHAQTEQDCRLAADQHAKAVAVHADVEKAAENSGKAPTSLYTLAMDGYRRAAAGELTSSDDITTVRALIDALARKFGVDVQLASEAKREALAEVQRDAARVIMPSRGTPRPVGQIVSPPGVAPIAPRIG